MRFRSCTDSPTFRPLTLRDCIYSKYRLEMFVTGTAPPPTTKDVPVKQLRCRGPRKRRRTSVHSPHAPPTAPPDRLEPLVSRSLVYPLPQNPSELARLETEGLLIMDPRPPRGIS